MATISDLKAKAQEYNFTFKYQYTNRIHKTVIVALAIIGLLAAAATIIGALSHFKSLGLNSTHLGPIGSIISNTSAIYGFAWGTIIMSMSALIILGVQRHKLQQVLKTRQPNEYFVEDLYLEGFNTYLFSKSNNPLVNATLYIAIQGSKWDLELSKERTKSESSLDFNYSGYDAGLY